MKTVIFCGGRGIRLSEHTFDVPKPMIPIGGKPVLWHIMKYYSSFGFNEFILCLGYKGEKIREYFSKSEWDITMVDTGEDSLKSERLLKVKDLVGETFFVAYGDDLTDANIKSVLEYHKKKGKVATLTATRPVSQYGIINIDNSDNVTSFEEKPAMKEWINGGFFVFNKEIFDYFRKGWELENEIFKSLAEKRQICAYRHNGFWKCMNTLKDVNELNDLWNNNPPWKKW
jgi:glucose-1-phosphate cytidylyltransferase